MRIILRMQKHWYVTKETIIRIKLQVKSHIYIHIYVYVVQQDTQYGLNV